MNSQHSLHKLCLPEITPSLRYDANGLLQILDPVRGKFVALTPEEWVRQNFVDFLVNLRGVPRGRIANEVGIRQNGCRRRCDSVIYDDAACPIAICEYKAPTVTITEKVFDQIVRYNMKLRVRTLIVSNGLRHYCCSISPSFTNYIFLTDIPSYTQL